jgi:putative heme-binding domain-containing protein
VRRRGDVHGTLRRLPPPVLQGRQGRPDLTSYQRDNLGTMLISIINPNAEIREGFQYHRVETKDGRSLSGFLVERDPRIVVLARVEARTSRSGRRTSGAGVIGRSLMPEEPARVSGTKELRTFRNTSEFSRSREVESRFIFMQKVLITGFGFMGGLHAQVYSLLPQAGHGHRRPGCQAR